MRGCLVSILALCLISACSSEEKRAKQKQPDPGPTWAPGTVFGTERAAGSRGWLDRRGIIHAHSVYSHDACDDDPQDGGVINAPCLAHFRSGLCWSRHDFMMLTDHNTFFSSTEYPAALLYDAAQGDQLLDRGQGPVGSWMACPGGDARPLVLAGCESGFMPVGIERHVSADVDERKSIYGADDAVSAQKLKDVGAVVLAWHTEEWTAEQLSTLPFDGFEMYNLHANAIQGMGAAIKLITQMKKTPEELPYPDLVLLPIISEDPRYLGTWGSVLASGNKRVTTMATDAHENTFRDLLPDGERIDSYRRMMGWFSNHLLVSPGAEAGFDDLALKEALRAGRLYGAFEVMGYPVGFDFFAKSGESVVEMGSEAELSAGVKLFAKRAAVQGLDPKASPPEIVVKLLKAKAGGWEDIAEVEGDLEQAVGEPGAYRVEVRMKPRHLVAYLSSYVDLAEKSFVWIYSNAIYVK